MHSLRMFLLVAWVGFSFQFGCTTQCVGTCKSGTDLNLDCGMNTEEKQVHEMVNQERSKKGLSPLKCDPALVTTSHKWSETQCQRGSIGHDGIDARYKETGISFSAAGENVAAGQRTPASVMNSWMNSSGHRANILSREYTHLGVGYVNCGKGMKHFWTQLFMKIR